MEKLTITERGLQFRRELHSRGQSEEIYSNPSSTQNISTNKPTFLIKKVIKTFVFYIFRQNHLSYCYLRMVTKNSKILNLLRSLDYKRFYLPSVNKKFLLLQLLLEYKIEFAYLYQFIKEIPQQQDQFTKGEEIQFNQYKTPSSVNIQRKSIAHELILAQLKLEKKLMIRDVYSSMSAVLNLTNNKKRDSIFRRNNFKFECFKEMNQNQASYIQVQIQKKMSEYSQAKEQPVHLVTQFLKQMKSEEKDLDSIFKLAQSFEQRFNTRIKQLHLKKYHYFWKDKKFPGEKRQQIDRPEQLQMKNRTLSQSNLSQLINQSQNDENNSLIKID